MDTLLSDFISFSYDLYLPIVFIEKVKAFLLDLSHIYMQYKSQIPSKALFACAIYIVAQDESSSDESTDESENFSQITVTKLLEKANISIMDFFSVICFLKTNYHLSDKVKQNLIALERKYLIVSALYDKFESMSSEIFCSDCNVVGQKNAEANSELDDLLKHRKALCWMLFIVAKAKVLWHRQELLATFHLLLCCIAEVIKTTPTFLLLPPFDSILIKSEETLTILKALSDHVKTKLEEVKAVYEGWLHVALELEVESKVPKLENLQSIYHELYAQSGDIDESLFLSHDWHLLPVNNELSSSPRKCPVSLLRRTLDTADALNKILLCTSDDLSESLKTCLKKCTIDGITFIQNFILQSRDVFIKAFTAQEGNSKSLAERRFRLASRYYYIMLDTFLKKESERLSAPEFTSFIQNKVFHRSLLSCCLEVTLMSCGSVGSVNFTPLSHGDNNNVQGIIFPWILKVFDLEAFQFFKIIESFIRDAPTITQQIIKHLKEIEDKILESLAWQTGSSVFNGLSGQGCSPTCKIKVETSKSSFWSPNQDSSESPSSMPHICHAVNLFLNKVSRLSYQRLEKLCSLLKISKEIQSNIWICIEHVIYKKPHLLKDRHIDQIIMCCIFAICKVLEHDVKFKTIIACYGLLPNSSVSVYKYVLSEKKKDFIIVFYNREFNIEMKDYILNYFGNKNKNESLPTLNILQSPFKLSPSYSIPGKKNIFVSPMLQSPFKNPNEIIHRKIPLYSVGSLTQSPKTLQTINESLNVLHHASRKLDGLKSKKRLQFNSDDVNSSLACSSAKKILKFDVPLIQISNSDEITNMKDS